MESSKMKNMVVLKNLPSNMVDEAIIIFKETQKVRLRETIDKNNNVEIGKFEFKSKEYILKEAEMLVEDYIKKIENKNNVDKTERSIKYRYKKLQKYSIVLTGLFIISVIINFL